MSFHIRLFAFAALVVSTAAWSQALPQVDIYKNAYCTFC